VRLPATLVATGDSQRIEWAPVPGAPVTYSVFLSRDGGANWEPVASLLEGTSIDWMVSGPPTTNAMLLVEARSPEGILLQEKSAVFTIEFGAASAGDVKTQTAFLGASPNPLTMGARLRYSLAHPSDVDLCLYDVQGRLVRRFVSTRAAAGEHALIWDGAGADGRAVASGVYLYVFRAAGVEAKGRLMVLR
jgi:hypothetical protein